MLFDLSDCLKKSVGVCSLVLGLAASVLPMTASARSPEPGTMNPAVDAAYMSSLGISSNDWNDQIVNVLVVGQDGFTEYHPGETYGGRPAQNKHADSNMLLSFNKRTGQVSILSIYRGFMVADEHWAGVAETPTVLTDRYLANYYLFAGRAKYVEVVRGILQSFIESRRLQNVYYTGGRLKIHGIIETGFDGFKGAVDDFLNYFGSSATIAWKMKGHAGTLASIIMNRGTLLSELRSTEGFSRMTEKRKEEVGQDPARSALGTLRERQRYPAAGYQRAFNHAKFVSYVLGLVGYTMADADFADFLKEPAITSMFGKFSRTFELSTFDQNLRVGPRKLHMIARTGFRNGQSPMYIVQIGTTVGAYAVYANGRAQIVDGSGFINKLMPNIELIPKPNDCETCR